MSHGTPTATPQTVEGPKAGGEGQPSGPSGKAVREPQSATVWRVALLTGGSDKPYALGLTAALTAEGTWIDFVGSDELAVPKVLSNTRVNFLNLRGDQSTKAGLVAKITRITSYYIRLLVFAGSTKTKVFHILWNNKFELFDRTFLMLFYKLLGKRVVLTAHNVNAGKRDAKDSFANQLSLRVQYGMSDHIFVHTDKMKSELIARFKVADEKISVIPFGINKTVRDTCLSSGEAKHKIGISGDDKTLLFFGQIAPYKGLHYLVSAFGELAREDKDYRLIIAGRPKWSGAYWTEVKQAIIESGCGDRVVKRIEYIPDDETEIYFKAADVLILPYTDIFQSGVLFLGYNFGLPAVVTEVGSLKEEIIEGKTGFVCKPNDSSDLAATIRRYFASPLFRDLDRHRSLIREFANERYSWSKVAAITKAVYLELAR
jgi:D-inositol-3-phosphate glycosyltransferase